MTWPPVAGVALALVLAPALPGVATRTRAFLTGRRGSPALQPYYELAKLLRKHAVYGGSSSWVLRAAPVTGLACVILASLLLPFDGRGSLTGFTGDFMLFAGLLALGRFALILAALDTGSSFEGMGASRDAMVGAFVEAALLLAFGALILATGRTSLAELLGVPLEAARPGRLPALAMLAVGLFVLLLAESSRVPVDDPATHLELTMIHEVAVLDYSGPDLALVLYAAAVRFTLLATLVVGVLAPRAALAPAAALLVLPAGLLAIAAAVGVVEATMARLRLNRIPQLLVAALALVAFATILLLGTP